MKPTAKLRRLLSRYVDFVDGKGWYPRKLYLDHVLLALMSKSLTTAQSVLCLIDNGFWDEAFASSRTLIDISYSVRFIANKDSEKRAQRFAEYYGKDREQWMKVISDYFPSLTYETSPDHARLMGFATKFASPYSWSGVTIRDMVSEPDSFETDKAGKPIDCVFSYRTVYRWTSHYVHPTIVALDDHIVGEEWQVQCAREQKNGAEISRSRSFQLLLLHRHNFYLCVKGDER